MANPTPGDVGKAGPRPDSGKVGVQPAMSDKAVPEPTPEPAPAPAPKDVAPMPVEEPARYRVLKGITLDDGRTVMPGEDWTPAGTWPARRFKQLVESKHLRPLNDTARRDAKADPAED